MPRTTPWIHRQNAFYIPFPSDENENTTQRPESPVPTGGDASMNEIKQ